MKQNRTKGRILAVIQFSLLIAIIVSAIIEYTHHHRGSSLVIQIVSYILLGFGIILVVITLFEFKQPMTPNPVPLDNQQLRTGGIYSFVRHPMYLSVLLILFGGTLYMAAYYTLVLDAAAVIFLVYKIGFEEKMLLEKFPSYKDYQLKTKKLLPFIF